MGSTGHRWSNPHRQLDLCGIRKGSLVAVGRTSRKYNGSYIWKLKCDCGSYCFERSDRFKAGWKKTCGKGKCNLNRYSDKELRRALLAKGSKLIKRTNKGRVLLECPVCGDTYESTIGNITSRARNVSKNRVHTCFKCSHRSGRYSVAFKGVYENQIGHLGNQFFNMLAVRTKVKNKERIRLKKQPHPIKHLKSKEFKKHCMEIWTGVCPLSGVTLKMGNGRESKLGNASLDRIDSELGYIRGNLRWIFTPLNRLKMELPDEIFLGVCRHLAKENKPHKSSVDFIEIDWGKASVYKGLGLQSLAA